MTRSPTPVPSYAPERGSSESAFNSTQWSVVLSAARSDPATSREALETLCRAYWRPLYAYVRRSGRGKEDAEDLVQGFFASFLERNAVEQADRERGRFPAYLLACLKHFMFNEWKRQRRLKRGGGVFHLSLDWQSAEQRYEAEGVDDLSPDRLYDREWALALIERVFSLLRKEFAREGKAEQFEHLKQYLVPGESGAPHEELANFIGKSPEAVRIAVHRLRKRYRRLLRQQVAETLSSPEHLKEEMRALIAALGK